jgi:hypothetical protein
MIGAKAPGEAKHVASGGRGHQHLHPHQIGAAARTTVFLDAFPDRHRIFLSIPK